METKQDNQNEFNLIEVNGVAIRHDTNDWWRAKVYVFAGECSVKVKTPFYYDRESAINSAMRTATAITDAVPYTGPSRDNLVVV